MNFVPTGMPPGGLLVIVSVDAAAGVTRLGVDSTDGNVPAENWSVSVPALSSSRSLEARDATCTVTVFVPRSVPAPLASEAVTCVLLSLVTRLPYLSSS